MHVANCAPSYIPDGVRRRLLPHYYANRRQLGNIAGSFRAYRVVWLSRVRRWPGREGGLPRDACRGALASSTLLCPLSTSTMAEQKIPRPGIPGRLGEAQRYGEQTK